MSETATEHKHYFTAIPCRLGPYGPQDVHYHSCIEGEPGDCYEVIMGAGAGCGGKDSPHEHMTLTEDGPQPAEALARLRPPVAADPGQLSGHLSVNPEYQAALLDAESESWAGPGIDGRAMIDAASERRRHWRASLRPGAAEDGKSAATEGEAGG